MPNMRWHLTLSEFAHGELPDKIHAALIERALGGQHDRGDRALLASVSEMAPR